MRPGLDPGCSPVAAQPLQAPTMRLRSAALVQTDSLRHSHGSGASG